MVATMGRVARKTVTLSDGTTIPKGAFVMTLNDRLLDPEKYPDPSAFDASRFAKLRALPGEENKHHFASVQPDDLGFGYGEHVCAGKLSPNSLQMEHEFIQLTSHACRPVFRLKFDQSLALSHDLDV